MENYLKYLSFVIIFSNVMPVEQYSFIYENRDFLLNIIFMNYDYGKYNGFFFIRDIDNIIGLNSSKTGTSKLKSTYKFRELKPSIGNEYYEAHTLGNINSAFDRLIEIQMPKRKSHPSHKTLHVTRPRTIVKYRLDNEGGDDDDDEIIIDEIGVLEYFYKCANLKKHPNFESQWREFLHQIRTPSNITKIHLNRMCIDMTSHVKLHEKIPLDTPAIEFMVFACTESMMEDHCYLITTTCDYNLTIEYLNEISTESYYCTYLVPVEDADRTYVELMEFIDKNYKHPDGKLRKKSKLLRLRNINPVHAFLESKRTRREFLK